MQVVYIEMFPSSECLLLIKNHGEEPEELSTKRLMKWIVAISVFQNPRINTMLTGCQHLILDTQKGRQKT